MSERRYSESEIREVFERAARDQQADVNASSDGLTLDEMQDVAASAGIAPEFVARAARSVALGAPEQGRTTVGPIARGVFRTEFLPGPPTDELWNELVADLRRTFAAQGTVRQTGRVREWRNGNLVVTLQPAGDDSRLHLQTRRDSASPQLAATTMIGLISLYAVTLSSIDTEPGKWTLSALMVVASLLGLIGIWTSQRSWASTRERQMEAIAQRAGARIPDASSTPAALPVSSPRIDAGALDLGVPDTGSIPSGTRTRA